MVRVYRWVAVCFLLAIAGGVRADVTIITTHPMNELPAGFENTAKALSNEFGKSFTNRNGVVITEKLKMLRVMSATHPNDPDVRCWLGVANVMMAERAKKSRSFYSLKAAEAFASAKTVDPNNICVQCVMISKVKQFNQMHLRSQYPATDAQCAMLPPPPAY